MLEIMGTIGAGILAAFVIWCIGYVAGQYIQPDRVYLEGETNQNLDNIDRFFIGFFTIIVAFIICFVLYLMGLLVFSVVYPDRFQQIAPKWLQ